MTGAGVEPATSSTEVRWLYHCATAPKVLRITNKRKIITNNYIMHGQILELVDSAKYFGVFFHKKISWNTHINYTAKKSNQVRCFVQRNLRTCHRDIKLQSYKTYVRPILEYGSMTWDSYTASNIAKLMVQRKAARFISSDWSYTSSPFIVHYKFFILKGICDKS